jgi:hypothetical protein
VSRRSLREDGRRSPPGSGGVPYVPCYSASTSPSAASSSVGGSDDLVPHVGRSCTHCSYRLIAQLSADR